MDDDGEQRAERREGHRDRAGQTGDQGGREGLGRIFEDLEQQAEGMHLAERDAELADRARSEYAAVELSSRIHASTGHEVVVTLLDGSTVEGTLTQAGVDWCTVVPGARRLVWLVRLAAVATVQGLSSRAVPAATRPAPARLGFGSALHRLAGESPEVLVRLASGTDLRVRVMRIGADFVEVETVGVTPPTVLLIAFDALVAVRG
jgi:hypothetical protein